MTTYTAIILAGGKGERFQNNQNIWQDKVLADLNGKPLLIHVIENITKIVDDLIIVVNENKKRIAQYKEVLTKHQIDNVKITTDIKTDNIHGPLIAILTGLKYANSDYCLTIPSDMPLLNNKVAQYMFNEIDGSLVALPMWPNGRLETLLMVMERKTILEIAEILVRIGRSHPDDIIRGALRTLFVTPLGKIRDLDPDLRSFVNINSRKDMQLLQPRIGEGILNENVRVDFGKPPIKRIKKRLDGVMQQTNDLRETLKFFSNTSIMLEEEGLFFWAALSREFIAKKLLDSSRLHICSDLFTESKQSFLEAAKNYGLEAKMFEEKKCFLLAKRALSDKEWCEAKAASLK